MAVWFFILVLFAVGESKHEDQISQTDLQAAMSDMGMKSYHGFVILLKIIRNSHPESLKNTDITFFMPNDEELSEAAVMTPDHLQEFILSHSMPTALGLEQLLHFPNGTLVPSNIPSKIISITNSRGSGLSVNNAKIVTPNVCASSRIRCHGISTTMTFVNFMFIPETLPINLHRPEFMVFPKRDNMASPATDLKMTPTQH